MKKILFAFDYPDMRLGGIQTIVYNYAKAFLARNAKIVWCIDKKTDVDKGFKDIINDQTISIMDHTSATDMMKKDVSLCTDMIVVMFSFNFQGFQRMSSIEKELMQLSLPLLNIRNYLIIPNYRGRNLMLEENSEKCYLEQKKADMRDIYQKLLDNGNLLFCNPRQKDSFQNHYELIVPNDRLCCIPHSMKHDEPECDIYEDRYISNQILTVGRFDFPHKAYILGLIDVYAELKEDIPNLELCIIGYGAGCTDVRKKIKKLSPKKQKDVVVIPGVPSSQLSEMFSKARVFVGLAGAATDAAASGLITLIARHFCEKCEVYGKYSDNSQKIISEEPGEDAAPYIRDIFAMNKDEYIKESRRTYEAYKRYADTRSGDIIKECQINKLAVLDEDEWRVITYLMNRYRNYNRIDRMISYLKSPLYTFSRIIKRYVR